VPFYWHVGRPNFGDDINPSFFQIACQETVKLQTSRDNLHFLGMGSILDRATSTSIILGSGCLSQLEPRSVCPANTISVRGELSRASLAQSDSVLLGDPMVLLNIVSPQNVQRNGPIGFVPHVSDLRFAYKLKIPNVKVIDPGREPWKVIREIAGCSRIFSQSLHGLIVADALEIPNIWIAPNASMTGENFKFEDYFTTLDGGKVPHQFNLGSFLHTPQSAFDVCTYKYDKKHYLEALRDAVASMKQDR